MARGKVFVIVSIGDTPVWRLSIPLDPRFVRHLTPDEQKTLEHEIPELIETVIGESPALTVAKPKRK
jgi:hypothetical protein